MNKTWILLFVIIFVAHEAHGQSNCGLATFQALGCYRDTLKNRVLPDLILNKRGTPINWINYDTFLPSLICDCAKEATAKGYRYFGIQFYGECWASKHFSSHSSQKQTRRCINERFQKCPKDGSDRNCSGKRLANFVYILQERAQPTTEQPQGTTVPTAQVDACTSNPCENGATCRVTGDDTYTCQCTDGFYGDSCEKVDACTRNPCKNGGSCTVTGDDTFSCHCTEEFFGDSCEKVNRCISSPCQHVGSCVVTGNNTYHCQCAEGFYGVNCEKDCSFPLDIALAIDASGSVGQRSYQLVKTFMKKLTHHFDVNHTVHFACLHFDHRVHTDFLFKDAQFHDHASLDAKLQNMTHPSGATLTDSALKEVKRFFARGNGARDYSKVRRVSIVLTDGQTYGGKERLRTPVNELKEQEDVVIVPIGVGWQVSEEELKLMAGRRSYVTVANFDALADAMYDVMDLVCTW